MAKVMYPLNISAMVLVVLVGKVGCALHIIAHATETWRQDEMSIQYLEGIADAPAQTLANGRSCIVRLRNLRLLTVVRFEPFR